MLFLNVKNEKTVGGWSVFLRYFPLLIHLFYLLSVYFHHLIRIFAFCTMQLIK